MSDHNQHTRNPGFKPGDNWAECQRCGFDIYGSKLKKEWTGLMVCSKCWEPRHPQDFVRARKEDTSPQELHTGNISAGDDLITLHDDVDAKIDITTGGREHDWNTVFTSGRIATVVEGLHYNILDYSRIIIYKSEIGTGSLNITKKTRTQTDPDFFINTIIYIIPEDLKAEVELEYYNNTWNLVEVLPL